MLPLKSKLFNCEAVLISILLISELSSLFSSPPYLVRCCCCADKALLLRLKCEVVSLPNKWDLYLFSIGFVAQGRFTTWCWLCSGEQQLCLGLVQETGGCWRAQGVWLVWQEAVVIQTPAPPGWNPGNAEVAANPLLTSVRLGSNLLAHRYISVPARSQFLRTVLCLLWFTDWNK